MRRDYEEGGRVRVRDYTSNAMPSLFVTANGGTTSGASAKTEPAGVMANENPNLLTLTYTVDDVTYTFTFDVSQGELAYKPDGLVDNWFVFFCLELIVLLFMGL